MMSDYKLFHMHKNAGTCFQEVTDKNPFELFFRGTRPQHLTAQMRFSAVPVSSMAQSVDDADFK